MAIVTHIKLNIKVKLTFLDKSIIKNTSIPNQKKTFFNFSSPPFIDNEEKQKPKQYIITLII